MTTLTPGNDSAVLARTVRHATDAALEKRPAFSPNGIVEYDERGGFRVHGTEGSRAVSVYVDEESVRYLASLDRAATAAMHPRW